MSIHLPIVRNLCGLVARVRPSNYTGCHLGYTSGAQRQHNSSPSHPHAAARPVPCMVPGMQWLVSCMLHILLFSRGIPWACRASTRLFLTKTFATSPGSYPSVSQKIMKGACSRFMTLWLAEITCKLVVDQLTAHRANVFISLANLFELMCANGRYWQSADAPKAFYQAYLVFRSSYSRSMTYNFFFKKTNIN